MHYVKDVLAVVQSPMVIIGVVGQVMFFSRFLVQWIASERKKQSVIPVAFWYLSIAGGGLLLVYAVWRRDPVFTIGQGVGLFVYVRNLILTGRHKAVQAA